MAPPSPTATATATITATATATQNAAPTASPLPGQYLLYEDAGAWVIRQDGTGKRKVSSGSPVGWSHDGSTIHLATDATKAGCQVIQLSNLPLDGGSETIVAASLKNGDWDFAWSPDDSKIAFFRPTIQRSCGPQVKPDTRMDLMIVDADGSHERKLAIGVPDGAGATLAWTPDSRSILVIQQDDDPPWAGPIVSFELSSAAPSQLSSASGSYVDVAVSPNESQMAYVAEEGGFGAAHVASLDGTDDRKLGDASSNDRLVAWSPDGGSLAILRTDRAGGPAHLVIATPPSGLQRDVYGPLIWKGAGPVISWSPDGSSLACIAQAGGIVVVDAGGTGAVHVPDTVGATNAFWQP
jgi:Tol biopolymer transport system component